MRLYYKVLILFFILVVSAFIIQMVNFVNAVPAAPSSTCGVTADVLSVVKKQAVIGSFVPSPNGENIISYYDINLDIVGISTYIEERGIYCDDSYTKNVEESNYPIILHEDQYNSTPISEGQRIKARISFGGDEFFHGYFLSGIQIEGILNFYRYNYWQCYNGEGHWEGDENSCKSYKIWESYTKDFCQDKCNENKSKCGVEYFNVYKVCDTIKNENDTFITEEEDESSVVNNTSIIETEGTIICKDSCLLDGKCYPFGYRKSDKFCSDMGSFVDQSKGDEVCENNFECSSNICVSGKCVEEGLINKILNWFKRLFS